MAGNTVNNRPNATLARRPNNERLDVRNSANAREVAANGLEGLAKSGAMAVEDAQAVAGQLDQAITTADQAEATAKKAASPEARSQARQMAASRETGLAAAMNARLPIEQLQATEIGRMDAARVGYTAVKGMDKLVTEMENIADTRSRVGEEIAGLEGKKDRTPGEDLLLEAKRQQAAALDATSQVLGQRVDTLRATKDAAMNIEEGGGHAFTEEETEQLRAATQATDVAAVAAATQGRGADAAVAMALEAVSQEQSAGNAPRTELSAEATGVPAPNEGRALPAGDSVTVKKGDWLTKIASAHKNADGSPVTLEQLLDTPGNEKFRAKPDLIHPGDVVKLPKGAVRAEDWKPAVAAAETETANANAPVATATKKNTGKPKLGLAPTTTKPLDANAINQSVARSNAQTRTLNDARQGLLDDGVGGLDAKVDPKRISADADAVIGRHQGRREQVLRVGAEIDAEIKDLSARTNRSGGEEALLQAKRAQRGEVDTLVKALDGGIASLQQLKIDASDGRITEAEAKGIMSRYKDKQRGVQDSVQAGMNASEQLGAAYDRLREPLGTMV